MSLLSEKGPLSGNELREAIRLMCGPQPVHELLRDRVLATLDDEPLVGLGPAHDNTPERMEAVGAIFDALAKALPDVGRSRLASLAHMVANRMPPFLYRGGCNGATPPADGWDYGCACPGACMRWYRVQR